MHSGKSDVLISFRGHTLLSDEFHAAVIGTVGIILGERGKVLQTILDEFWYFLGSFVVCYIIGMRYRENE